jgi:glucose/arabinose dehydrogenase
LAADTIQLAPAATGLSAPVVATHAGDGSGRMFIAEQTGAIRILRDGTLNASPFLDLGGGGLNRIVGNGERGLLGLAFHPDFATPSAAGEGKFYVYYSAAATSGGDHDSVISEFQISADPDSGDANSERELLRFSQPFSNHNGGDLHFGPDDGLLYISTGDGGSGGDPQNNAQNLGNLLGKILRVDVDGNNGPGGQYGIPASNPFVGQAAAREEIYAYGLRNPYRFSFDDGPTPADADRLFAGDVGQASFEEVDLIDSGSNYGWRIREGAHPFNTSDPDPGNLIDPIAEYANDSGTDAVIGGYVYRGTRFPALQGHYIFGDLLGKMFVLEENAGSFTMSDLNVDGGNPQGIIGFGQDEAGELYVLTFSTMLAIEVDTEVADPIDVGTDLDGANGFVLNGIDPDDDSGRSVSSAGDVNGDGFDDLLIGADGADPNGTLSGEAYVVFGKPTGFPASFELSSLDGSNGFILNGVAAFDRAGLASSSAGDVNGDGVDDLLIGALEADGSSANSGQSYVVFGSRAAFPANIELSSLDGGNGFTINGAAESDFSGASVAAAGDVNGDGVDDILLGAPYADPGGRDKAGAAYVLFGSSNGFAATVALDSLTVTSGLTINGVSSGDQAGFAVGSAGDVNGDGLADVIVGSYDASPNGSSSGASYVVFGDSSFASPLELSSLDGSNGFAINGIAGGDYSGRAVGRGGDVNGDGFDDVIVGGSGVKQYTGESYVVFGKGTTFSASIELAGLSGSDGFAIGGVDPGDELGRSVAGLGDVNGDGFDDVIIGAFSAAPNSRDSAGESFVVFGRASFAARIELSALTASDGFVLQGADADDFFGLAAGGAGDVNGDGLHDAVIGAPSADPGGNSEEGESYLIFGSDFTESITHVGDENGNTLTGDSADDAIVGGAGDDTLIGGGGGDVLLAGQGNDQLVISDAAFHELAGGRGEDTVRVEGNGTTIDLTQIPDNRVTGIERFDITGNGGNALVLTVLEVLNLSNTSNSAVVRADSNDNVDIGPGWNEDGIESIDDEFYTVFRQGAAKLSVLITDHPAWQNQANEFDVDNDTFVAPVDVLLIINELDAHVFSNSLGELPAPPAPPNLPPPFVDVDGDTFVSPLDGLLIINFLNDGPGEGEAPSGINFVAPAATVTKVQRANVLSPSLPIQPSNGQPSNPAGRVASTAPRGAHHAALRAYTSPHPLDETELDAMFAELAAAVTI